MNKIQIDQSKIHNIKNAIKLCPFGAIEYIEEKLQINSACKFCNLCIKNGPKDAFILIKSKRKEIDKSNWNGILVYAEHFEGEIHPVTIELIGKAKQMAGKINHPVYSLIAGSKIKNTAEELLTWGVDEVFAYDMPQLKDFKIEPYTAAFEDVIRKVKPSVVLVGGTNIGRSLAPRTAARFRTGLTADCTILDIQKNTDLDQIRPAFGGNIMAHIQTPNHRPQFATVRYKIFSPPEKDTLPNSKVTLCIIDKSKLSSNITIQEIKEKKKTVNIEDAELIVVAGRAFKKEEDLNIIYELANNIEAQVAGTRPLIEAGWFDPRKQIGLSGRTVKPKLIITCGVSGSVQFAAGMNGSDTIISINTDRNAPIFDISHYAIVGDVYEILPKLIKNIKVEGKLL